MTVARNLQNAARREGVLLAYRAWVYVSPKAGLGIGHGRRFEKIVWGTTLSEAMRAIERFGSRFGIPCESGAELVSATQPPPPTLGAFAGL